MTTTDVSRSKWDLDTPVLLADLDVDTTVCLHDQLVGIRGDSVEVVWPIPGRGKLT